MHEITHFFHWKCREDENAKIQFEELLHGPHCTNFIELLTRFYLDTREEHSE